MDDKLTRLMNIIKEELGLLFSISIGVFLFILFFQPFLIEKFDFNNRLLFVAGLGTIVFVFMVIVRIIFPRFINKYHQHNYLTGIPSFMIGFILLALSSVAFAFYLRYVGSVQISFYIMFKIILICFAPPVVLGVYDKIKGLEIQNKILIRDKKIIQKQIDKYEESTLNKTIELVSEKSNENLSLLVADIALIKSADNYVEVVYKEGENLKKKLIRNTLKNIELITKPYNNFIRCHRICIVNTYFIEKLNRNYNTHWLTIKGYTEQIPVSRQYLLKLKETV